MQLMHCRRRQRRDCRCLALLTACWRSGPGAQVRLQRPTVTAEMSLMLAIAKFFIAGFSLGSSTPTAFHTSDLLLKGACPEPPCIPGCFTTHCQHGNGVLQQSALLHEWTACLRSEHSGHISPHVLGRSRDPGPLCASRPAFLPSES